MRPPAFEFLRPSTVEEAVAAAAAPGEGMFYSGGTELLLAMKLRIVHADRLIDIKGVGGLDGVALTGAGEIEIGARCTHKNIAEDETIRRRLPALSRLCADVANVRVRSAGTIGGNLCFGEPHADPPTLLAALGARLRLVGPDGERIVPADDFILDELQTVRAPDELLTHILVPLPNGPLAYSRFRHGQRPAVNVAMLWTVEHGSGTIAGARIRAGALGPRPQRLDEIECALSGAPLADASRLIEDRLAAQLDALDVIDDRYGGADYKRHLAGVLLRRNAGEAAAEWEGRRR